MVGKYAERHKLAWEISNLKSLEICPFHHKEFYATITEHLLKKLWILSPLDQKFINHFKNQFQFNNQQTKIKMENSLLNVSIGKYDKQEFVNLSVVPFFFCYQGELTKEQDCPEMTAWQFYQMLAAYKLRKLDLENIETTSA